MIGVIITVILIALTIFLYSKNKTKPCMECKGCNKCGE